MGGADTDLSRRNLLAGGFGVGVSGIVGRQEWETTTPEDVANGLACCTGVIDFTLVLGLKSDLEELRDAAQELIPRTDHLEKVMPVLVDRLKPLSVHQTSRSFAETTRDSTTEVSRALKQLEPRLADMLSDEVLSGQTSDSIALFVSKISSVASLMAQVSQSLVLLRRALESENIDANEYHDYIEGKLDAWPAILAFMESSRSLLAHHQEMALAVENAKARLGKAIVALNNGTHASLQGTLGAGLTSDLGPIRSLVKEEDRDAFNGTVDLLTKIPDQAGRRVQDAMRMASIGGYSSDLRERVVKTLAEATSRRATSYQVAVVVLAARAALLLPSLPSQKNMVATAILLMLPRLPFDPRNLATAVKLAEAILSA